MTILEDVRAASAAIASAQQNMTQAIELIRASAAVVRLLAAENAKLLTENRMLLAEMANLRAALGGFAGVRQ